MKTRIFSIMGVKIHEFEKKFGEVDGNVGGILKIKNKYYETKTQKF